MKVQTKSKLVLLIIIIIIIVAENISAQAKNNLIIVQNLIGEFSESSFKIVCKSKLDKSFKKFLKQNNFVFSKQKKNSIRCFDCSSREITFCTMSDDFSIICYKHKGIAEHYHMIVYDNESRQYSNIITYNITSKEDWLMFFKYEEFRKFSLAQDY